MTQSPRVPDTEVQRAAMRKLSFLVGRWHGETSILRGSGGSLELSQTEEAEYKLDGLVLIIQGVGRSKADGKPALQALGMISYDDEARTYNMRAYNDGRYLETEVRLAEAEKVMTWAFVLGEIRTSSVLRMDDAGDWTEFHEISMNSEPPRKFMEVRVHRQG